VRTGSGWGASRIATGVADASGSGECVGCTARLDGSRCETVTVVDVVDPSSKALSGSRILAPKKTASSACNNSDSV